MDFNKLLAKTKLHPVMGEWLNNHNALPINMAQNSDNASITIDNPNQFQAWINEQLNGKEYGYGGYFEKRDVYAQSKVFNNSEKARNIHLGIDIWTKDNTPIFCPLAGVLVGKNNLSDKGNYGGVAILKHRVDNITFYTLYGHLNYESITKNIGDTIDSTEQIGLLGNYDSNGHWPPHLHLQIMWEIDESKNDYPGVCFEEETSTYKANCPNPSHLFFKTSN